jgi:hypothetical protein
MEIRKPKKKNTKSKKRAFLLFGMKIEKPKFYVIARVAGVLWLWLGSREGVILKPLPAMDILPGGINTLICLLPAAPY